MTYAASLTKAESDILGVFPIRLLIICPPSTENANPVARRYCTIH